MILEQVFRKISLKNGKARVWLEGMKLAEIGLTPGSAFKTEVDEKLGKITLLPSIIGNVVSFRKRKGQTIPIIDKSGPDIRTALEACTGIKVTFFKDETGSRVIIEGVRDISEVVRSKNKDESRQLSSITFCCGAGISASCSVDAGFKEVAGVEYNPKVGAENRYSEVFSVNHPETVMFNVPLEILDANDLPDATAWIFTLDCTDFSLLASSKSEDKFITKDLYLHLASLFKQRSKDRRPEAVLIENVPGFEKEAGSTLKIFFRKMGYSVADGKLNSLDFGSRTERKRYFFVACAYEGFSLPVGEGRLETPIIEDGVITLDNLNWVNPETDGTLKYFVERNESITHNHKISSIDILTDTHFGTIPKSHHKKLPENIIRHPFKSDTFAFLMDVGHLRYLHGIRESIYLGDSRALQIQSIGQGVCVKTFFAIVKRLHDFLSEMMFGSIDDSRSTEVIEPRRTMHLAIEHSERSESTEQQLQYCFGF